MDIYSNAFNFSSYINGSVDLRTGQYGCHIKLAAFNPQGPLEASRDISLGFSMFDTKNNGCGIGWRLSNTEFDESRRRLTLLSGEQYQTDLLPSVGGTLKIINHKLKDIVVKRPDTTTLQVVYNDGTIEILRRTGSTQPYRIVAILFENGERLTFRYGVTGLLERILNQKQEELLVLTYSNGNLSIADTRVDGGRYARVWFLYTNNRLTQVSAPFDRSEARGTASYVFEYRSAFRNGMVPIMRVRSPMGGEELITYAEQGHQYANNQFIPRVTSWVRTPAAKQPPMTLTYVYSPGRNFTGYPFSGGFREGEDNLYQVVGDYEYWTEERSLDSVGDTQLSATHTTYNKYHLLTEERVVREGTRTTTAIIYNTQPGQFPNQPPNFHLPKTIIKRYELVAGGTPREEIQHIETDDYGNELSRTEPSGIRTEYSYYPITGEPGKCPADPHGLFQRYLKQEKIISADTTVAPRITEQTHTQIQTAQGDYFVLQHAAARDGVVQTLHTYHEAADNFPLNGRLKSNTTTIDNLAQVTDFTYTFEDDTMTETRRFKGREVGQWLDSVRTLSLTNRRVLALTNAAGAKLVLSFDVTGRLTAESTAVGDPRVAGRQYTYHFATAGQQANLVTTDAQGNKVITYFDGMGRQVSTAQVLGEDTLRPISSRRYDGQGRCIEQTRIDYLGEAGQRALKTLFAYNAWGNPSRTTQPDGRVLIDEYDPLHHLKKTGVVGQAQWETIFNQYDQPARMVRVGVAGERLEMETRTYDGLGRCATVTNARQTRTTYTYDAFDRVVNTCETPTDGTAPRQRVTTYMAGTSEELVSAISVDAKRVGASTYDSLGRLTSQTRGVRDDAPGYTWEYSANSVNPNVFISPHGDRQVQTFDEQLDVLTEARTPGFAPMLFSHDPKNAARTVSQMSSFKHERTYDAYGHPLSDVQTADGKVLKQNHAYSPNGRLLQQTSIGGQSSSFEYDAQGRLERVVTGVMVMTQAYDDVGRLIQVSTAQTGNATAVDAKITFDAWGRESSRILDVSGRKFQRIASTYHPDGLLATRRILDAQEQLVIGETFAYDGYGRLSEYRCDGKEFPRDRLGRSVNRQCFQHDGLDNITQVDTYFADGTHDISKRSFTYNDPTQLSQVTHTHPAQTRILIYDVAGNLLEGAPGRVFTFNALDQLTAVQTDTFTYSYQYDAEFRQILAARGSEPAVRLAYADDRLDALIEGNKNIRYLRSADTVLARTGGVEGEQQHLVDASGSVRAIAAAGQPTLGRHYTPYGNAYFSPDDGKVRTMADLQLPAFNGERLDIPVNLYHLGNGRRAYDPELMVFLSPDPLSPFGEGGINSYAYCACDPVNRSDPEGLFLNLHHWLLTFAFLALSVAGVVTGGVALAAAAAAGTALTASIIAVVSASAGVVAGVLGVASLSVAEVDSQQGWDRSNHIENLNVAAVLFSLGSVFSSPKSITGYLSLTHDLYNATDHDHGPGSIDVKAHSEKPLNRGLMVPIKQAIGPSYKFTDAVGVSQFSKSYDVFRSNPKMGNLKMPPGRNQGSGAEPSQNRVRRFMDSQGDSANYVEEFRKEISRIRQPILSEWGRV
ncbi:RHS repeat-associated core domain-containing protein [Pseudomonas libanensis]|uniref:Teneurin-like YD-shell domain-containing protein n=1 Tax=Pseudomonas libanensis TaxID=75588 RepID=A0A0R2Y7R9_9PSED|nr:RHS repeat-associated core domain-containing protein [Pseudomonas libanensis]KRP44624.1 hypothetical protein TU73_15830 [Pseudomonas libanensis]SDL02353.1 RHS repeat-associated core domain-containing protein [Pseudomonas libanensis]